MSSRTKPSYDIKTQPLLTPGQNYDLEPDNTAPKSSYDLTRPTEGFPTDFVSQSKGGTFFNKIKYSTHPASYVDLDLVTKKFVVDSIAAIDLSTIEATLLTSISVFPANDLLAYDNTTGRFTLSISSIDTTKWNTAYGWGDHSTEGYLIPPADDGKLYGIVDGEWVEIVNGGAGATELNELSDVTIGGIALANRHALMYNSGTSLFVNRLLIEDDISDLQSYLLDITGESIGDLNDVTLSGKTAGNVLAFNASGILVETAVVYTETDPVFLAWDKSTGISITKSQVSDFGIYEVPLTIGTGLERAIDGFTINNTDGGSTAVTTHTSTISHALLTGPNIIALQAVSGTNTGDETAVSIKAALGEASAVADGYLTSTHWSLFNSKQPSTTFTAGFVTDSSDPDNLEVSFDLSGLDPNGMLAYEVDDASTGVGILWTSTKIASLFTGVGDTSRTYIVTISAGAGLTQKLLNGTTEPSGWTLTAVGGTSTTLRIDHALGLKPASLIVYSVVAGVATELTSTSAYGDMTISNTDNRIELSSYVNADVATEIKIIF